ncbi:MAG: phage portal protein, partial [Nanoarchaeota archaeon]|nr:phage portal protein [Nanoarchaeota archaeon]
MNWIQKQVYKASIFIGAAAPAAQRTGSQPAASSGYWGSAYSKSYDGEKNLGELGDPVEYYLNFKVLSIRAWQSYLESELSQTIINKYIIWMVDGGLKLQANPAEKALALSGVEVDPEKFNEDVEALFSLWSESRSSSFSGMENLNTLAKDVYKHSKIGGDVLVVLRLVNGSVKVQMIDGSHVESPIAATAAETGNKIIDGVEVDKAGEHIAYHVRTTKFGKYDRVPARSKSS